MRGQYGGVPPQQEAGDTAATPINYWGVDTTNKEEQGAKRRVAEVKGVQITAEEFYDITCEQEAT